VVLGSGVIACEYASIFASLGCAVTMLTRRPSPWGPGGLAARRLRAGLPRNGRPLPRRSGGRRRRFDGFSQVEVEIKDGEALQTDIVFAAFGASRISMASAWTPSVSPSARAARPGERAIRDQHSGLYAAGDAIGPPALACAAADQGRRAALAAFGLPPPPATSLVPTGVYTIPEIACVGLSQGEAAAKKIDVIVGRADFREVARAHIAGSPAGFLTLVCERASSRVLGVQVLGEGATELVHLGRRPSPPRHGDFFIEQIFNFPTLSEAYRIAAFHVMKQRAEGCRRAGPARANRLRGGVTIRPRTARRDPRGSDQETAKLAALDLGGAGHQSREIVGHGLLSMVRSIAPMIASAASSHPM